MVESLQSRSFERALCMRRTATAQLQQEDAERPGVGPLIVSFTALGTARIDHLRTEGCKPSLLFVVMTVMCETAYQR